MSLTRTAAAAGICSILLVTTAPIGVAQSPAHPQAIHRAVPIEVNVGVAAPLSGEMAWVGKCVREAAGMTRDEVNDEPGHKMHFNLVFADTGSTPAGAVRAVRQLLESQRLSILLGPMLSGEALATEPLAEAAHIPQVFPISSSHLITHEGDPWAIRTGIDEWLSGDLLADWLLRSARRKRVAVLSLPDAYSSSGADGLVRGLKRRGVAPVLLDRLQLDSFDDAAVRLKAERAGAVGFFGYPEAALSLLDALRRHAVNIQVVSGGALGGDQFLKLAGARANGMVVASEFSPDDDARGPQLFTRRFQARFHHEPGNQHALVYDAMWLIASAVEHAGGVSPDRLRFSLHHIHGLREATGDHTLNRAGEDVRCPLLLRIAGGRFHLLEKGRWGPANEVRG